MILFILSNSQHYKMVKTELADNCWAEIFLYSFYFLSLWLVFEILFDCRPCDVAKVLKQLGQAANGLANQRGQNLQITSCSPLHAAVNSAGLQRVCSHLLEIALQHTPKGGHVRADAMRAPGGGVLIIIEDNGPNTTVSSKNDQ